MAALTSSQMMVAAPVVAKAGAASKAKAVAPRRAGIVSFSAKLGVSNGTEQKTNAFYIWKSQGNKFFETFSFLPPMDDAQLMKQITYMIKNKFNPCVEFEFPEKSIAVSATLGMGMDSRSSSTFYANRYWSMWKLPMYGATDADQVMAECKKCAKTFPNAFVRLVGFDAARQTQMVGFITHRPAGGEAMPVNQRSVESN